jgi:superfamily I DNA/RNA helicase
MSSFDPTPEQQAILDADLKSVCVIACPGSGKTATAVRRVFEIRKRIGDDSGYVLLLSFSNVAVDTFQREYEDLSRQHLAISNRVRIDTIDGLIASFIVRPHGSRLMGSIRQPFLVSGSEPFLSNYTVWGGSRPRKISSVVIKLDEKKQASFVIRENYFDTQIDKADAIKAIKGMAQTGAYTYELGRYWALRLLRSEPLLLSALSRRFPHIVVDEAQDICPLHEVFLKLLKSAGSTVTLIGDPNQAIYEFADADGGYLKNEAKNAGDNMFTLSQNRRSLATIVGVANLLTNSQNKPIRDPGGRTHGTYYIKYDTKKIQTGLDIFHSILVKTGYSLDEAALLCRGMNYITQLSGAGKGMGTGATENLIDAAIFRDQHGDIAEAFNRVVLAILRLLEKPENDLKHKLLGNTDDSMLRKLRRLLWKFLREESIGLPSANLKAETEWFPKLKVNVGKLLDDIEAVTNYKRSKSWGNNITKKALADSPLSIDELLITEKKVVRIDTVHKAKGESIPAVMYLATTSEIKQMIAGTETEEGRIGYVAITRAKDLLILGVPASADKTVIAAVEQKGFKLWQ